MTRTIPVATQRLALKLHEAENALDAAYLALAGLATETIETRVEFRSHPAAARAHPAMLRIDRALANLTAASGDIRRAHGEMKTALTITSGPATPENCPEWVRPAGGLELEAVTA